MLVVARIVLMTLLNQLAWFPPSGAPPPYAESWLEACLSVTPATRREGSAPANAESRSGHGIMVPGRACSALQFSDFCCPGRQCLRALGHPIFRGLIPSNIAPSIKWPETGGELILQHRYWVCSRGVASQLSSLVYF